MHTSCKRSSTQEAVCCFTEAVAKALLMQISIGTQANHRTRLESENEHLLHNFVPLKSLPLYNKDSELCTATYASRL